MTDIFVAGEGAGEIGRWVEPKERRATSQRTNGVLFELYSRKRADGSVIDGKAWSKIPKYRAGGHATADQRTLRQLAVIAEEAGADTLLWARDSDHDSSRALELCATHDDLRAQHASTLEIIGGVVEPCLEAWIVGLKGIHQSPEALSVPRLEQLAKDNDVDREEAMVAVVREAELRTSNLPSLKRWLDQF